MMRLPLRPHVMLLLLTCSLTPTSAQAQVDFSWGGHFQSDLRFRLQEKSVGGFHSRLTLPTGPSWNQNYLKLKGTASAGSFAGVADIDLLWIGYSRDLESISDLGLREKVDPYRLKVDALYVEALGLGLEGLDLRVGQQLVLWGKGDQFNPTNVLNPNDLEDVLTFGERLANFMVRADYTFSQVWTVSGVLVPIFKPAILPPTAILGTASLDRLPFVSEELRWRIHAEQALTGGTFSALGLEGLDYPTALGAADPLLPEHSFGNMQAAGRLAGIIGEHDVSLHYYYGRTDIPQAFLNYTRMVNQPSCNPLDPTQCIDGVLLTEASLGYPKMQMVALNMAGQINPLGWLSDSIQPIGYRLEVGLFFPQAYNLVLLQEPLDFGPLSRPGGEYAYYNGYSLGDPRPLAVDDTPFAKWALGLDYTFNRYLYANVQWVHGFPDEFGAGDFFSEGFSVRSGGVDSADTETMLCVMNANGETCARELLRPRLGDYLVLGVDVKFASDRGFLRLFTIWDLNGITEERWDPARDRRVRTHHSLFSEQGFSAIIYPELNYNFGQGFELGGGVLLALGQPHTKFGDPSVGGSLVWTRARFSF